MVLNMFQVRLRDAESPQGFREGLVGSVVGMVPTQTKQGMVEVYKVLWFNFDEETGEYSPNLDAAAPSSHLATELIGHVDNFDDNDDDEDDDEYEDEDEEEETSHRSQSMNSNTQRA